MSGVPKPMAMILCDTNIFIEVYRSNAVIRSELEKIGYDNIVISDVTRAELFYGAINKVELKKIRKDLDNLINLSIHPDISEMAVSLVEHYCLSHKMDFEDAMIAATAIYYDIELFTLNLKDFIFIPHLKMYQFHSGK